MCPSYNMRIQRKLLFSIHIYGSLSCRNGSGILKNDQKSPGHYLHVKACSLSPCSSAIHPVVGKFRASLCIQIALHILQIRVCIRKISGADRDIRSLYRPVYQNDLLKISTDGRFYLCDIRPT